MLYQEGSALKKVEWCGYSFLNTDIKKLSLQFRVGSVLGTGAFHFVNVYSIVCADKDSRLGSILKSEELISDGVPISRIIKVVSGQHIHVRGPDFMLYVLRNCDKNIRHYFLGSTQLNMDLLLSRLKLVNPELQIAGAHVPDYFENPETEVQKWFEDIKNSNADIIWVGLGTPKQDFAISLLSKMIPANFIGVGAAFDFLAGTKPVAPEWIQKIGMEWFFRLIDEPSRLWRRYLIGNLYFLSKFTLPSIKLFLLMLLRMQNHDK